MAEQGTATDFLSPISTILIQHIDGRNVAQVQPATIRRML